MLGYVHFQPTVTLRVSSFSESIRVRNRKIVEKRLRRAKSEEMLAEARSDIDVRIVRDTFVLEAKYLLNHPVAGSSEVILRTAGVEQLIK